MLFGVIVTMTTIGSLTIAGSNVAEIALIIAVTAISVNISHAVLHGYLFVFEKGFERGKYVIDGFRIKAVNDKNSAVAKIETELNADGLQSFSDDLKKQLALEIYEKAKGMQKPSQPIKRADFIGGFYKGLLVFAAGFLVILPLFIFSNLLIAQIFSFSIAIASLGILGWFYGKYIFKNQLRIALELIAIGLLIVVISLLLGG